MNEPTLPEATAGDRSYRFHERVGRGGFGTVYRGRLTAASGFEKDVAIKVLHANTPNQDEFAARMRDEARLLAALRHRAVVAVEDLIHVGEQVAIVMELVEGADLAALLKLGPVPPRAAVEVGREVAWALEAAHKAVDPSTGQPMGVVHRDIKPANIRITPSGDVKVMDFGVARARFSEREARTESLSFGSWGYMAPERFDEEEETSASDIYALGAVLFESLVGARLKQLSVNPEKHRRALQRALQRTGIDHAPLQSLLARMMRYEIRERPSAGEVAAELRTIAPALPGAWLNDWAPEALRRLCQEAPDTVLLPNTGSGARPKASAAPPAPGVVPVLPPMGALGPSLLDVPEPRALSARPEAPSALDPEDEPRPTLVAPRSADDDLDDEDPFATSLSTMAFYGARAQGSDARAAEEAAAAAPELVPGTQEEPPEAAPVAEEAPPRGSLSAGVAAIAALLVVVLGGLAAWWLLGPTPEGQAPSKARSAPPAATQAPVAPRNTAPVSAPEAPVSPEMAPSPQPPVSAPESRARSGQEAASLVAAAPAPEAAPASAEPATAEPTVEAPSAEPPGPAPAAEPTAPEQPAATGPERVESLAASLSGTWQGEALGRPLVLRLTFGQGGQIAGSARLRLGAQEVVHPVAGRYTLLADGTGTLEFSETDGGRPATYTGRIAGSSASGQVLVGGNARGTWSARR